MFPNRIDRLGCQKREIKKQQTKKRQGKNKQIKNGNNSPYHEPLFKEWIGSRS